MRRVILVFAALLIAGTLAAQEAKFQAMTVYNFTRTLQWPPAAQSGDFVITVLDDGDLYDELKKFTAGKKVRGEQQIVVRKATLATAGKTQILIIPKSKNSKLKEAMNRYTFATLIVTEQSKQTRAGAGISFTKDKSGVVQYQYNPEAISKQKINISTSFKQIGLEN